MTIKWATPEQKAQIAQIANAFKLGERQSRYLELLVTESSGWDWGNVTEERRIVESLTNKGLITVDRKNSYWWPKLTDLSKMILAKELPAIDGWERHLAHVKAAKVAELRAEAAKLTEQADALVKRADALEGR